MRGFLWTDIAILEKGEKMYYSFQKRNMPFFAKANLSILSPIPHIHHHIELIYLYEGQGYATADNHTILLSPGDLFFVFPNQIHYYDNVPVKGCLIIVSPDIFPDLADIFNSRLPKNPIIKKDKLPDDIYAQLQRICECVNSADKLHKIAANGYMQGLMAEMLSKMSLIETETYHDSVRDILFYCFENYKDNLTLDTLVRDLHLSKYYISHIFANRLNTSFPDLINGLRIESACRRLDNGCDITDAAFESGFSSIRSFNRNFKRIMGTTPTEYVKKSRTHKL